MVRKEERRSVLYFCEICHNVFDSRKRATECEIQAPKKINLLAYGNRTIDNWKIGDMVIVHIHDDWRKYRMGIIEDSFIKEHEVLPKISFLDKEPQEWDQWNFSDVHLLEDTMKDRILEWTKIIKALRNPSSRVDQDS